MANVTKDSGWLHGLNQNDLDNATIDYGWTSTGMVFTNGFSSNDSSPLQYRIIKFGTSGVQIVQIAGIIVTTTNFKVEKSVAKAIVTLPKTVKDLLDGTVGKCKSISNRETNSNWGTMIEFTVGNNGIVNVQSRIQDTGINELIFTDLVLIIGKPE